MDAGLQKMKPLQVDAGLHEDEAFLTPAGSSLEYDLSNTQYDLIMV